MNWKEYIVADSEVLAGKPVVKGTRVSVELILDRLADGWTEDDLIHSYSKLTSQAIHAVFAFAAEVMKDEKYVARKNAVA